VRTQISGQLVQLGFQEGQMVKQGDTLAVIDPRPYENALAQAEGQLQQAQSQLRTAQLDLERYETLAKEDSISKQQVDTAQSQVNQYRGLVQADQAAIDTVKLNLTYCRIKAPVDGRVGLRLVDIGNYITPSDTGGIVVLTQVKPISVIFTLPEDSIGVVSSRLHAGAKLPVQALDRTQSRELATGTLATIDNQIDTSTGTFRLRAEFINDDETLFPNQFVNIRMLVDTQHDVIALPTSAIERGQQGTFVYVVQPDDSAAVVPITLGPIEGERVAITSGLNVGDRVVIDGADKLRDGMKVILTDGAAPGRGGRGGRGGAAGGGDKKWRGGEDGGKKSRAKTDGTQ
jgi:multidrug efflux system membrane fusion protein